MNRNEISEIKKYFPLINEDSIAFILNDGEVYGFTLAHGHYNLSVALLNNNTAEYLLADGFTVLEKKVAPMWYVSEKISKFECKYS